MRSAAIHSNACKTSSLSCTLKGTTHFPKESYQNYDPSNIYRCNSTESDMEEYEMVLIGYEDGFTTIAQADGLKDERNTNISVIDGQSTVPSAHQNQHNALQSYPLAFSRRSIFPNNYSKSEYKLPSYRYFDGYLDEVSSTSVLLPTRRTHQLPLRRSPSAILGSVTLGVNKESRRRVTFDSNIKVVDHSKPRPVQISDGWSKWYV